MARTTHSSGPESTGHSPHTSPLSPAPADAGPSRPEVLVVGAGPTGLLLAGDLAVAGHRVTLVERRDGATSNLTRALVVHARTLELLDARGLGDELASRGHRLDRMNLFGSATLEPTKLPSRYPFVLAAGQFETERLLERRAREAGVVFRHDAELTALQQDATGVEIEVRGKAGTETLRAAYLVGTDGVRSTVREALGLPFPGRSVIRSMVLADVRLDDPPGVPFFAAATDSGFALIGSFGDGWHRVVGWQRGREQPDDAPLDLEEVRELTRAALGSDFGMRDPRWMSRFHSDERQAPSYRVGRVFLAGDAAHAHSPAGGMGMNTGLQDAANLSWKLSAVLRGSAPTTLLDTYEAERHPVGKLVLRLSGTLVRVGMMNFPGSVRVRALTSAMIQFTPPLKRRAMLALSGIGISYPAGPRAHPLTGKRAPDLALTSGRLYETLREGKFVLVTPHGSPAGRNDDPRFISAESARSDKHTLLIRPDGYIAWAGNGPNPQGLDAALATWTGRPDHHPTPQPTT